MKKYLLLPLLLLQAVILPAQKKTLDTTAVHNWPKIKDVQISGDGKYLVYSLVRPGDQHVAFLRAVEEDWEQELPASYPGSLVFTNDSRHLMFHNARSGSLGMIDLANRNELHYVKHLATNYQLPPKGNGQWLAYRPKDKGTDVVLLDLFSGKETNYRQVKDYQFDNNGNNIALTRKSEQDSTRDDLVLLDLRGGQIKALSPACQRIRFLFDDSGKGLAFTAEQQADTGSSVGLWYYKFGADSPQRIDLSALQKEGLAFNGIRYFSEDGDKLFIYGNKKAGPPPAQVAGINIEVWNYQDEPFERGLEPASRLAVVDLADHYRVTCFQKPGDIKIGDKGNYAIIDRRSNVKSGEFPLFDIYLTNLKDNSRELLKKRLLVGGLCFSKNGKYVIWYDCDKRGYYTHNILTGKSQCISGKIKYSLAFEKDGPLNPGPIGLAGWLDDDKAVLIYDRYDIWRVDPDGIRAPVNLTRGYGRRTHTELRLLNFHGGVGAPPDTLVKIDTTIILGFDLDRKNNSFYSLPLSGSAPINDCPAGHLSIFMRRLTTLTDRMVVFTLRRQRMHICILSRG